MNTDQLRQLGDELDNIQNRLNVNDNKTAAIVMLVIELRGINAKLAELVAYQETRGGES